MLVLLCLTAVIVVRCALNVPVYTSSGPGEQNLQLLGQIEWDEIQDPSGVVRRFCNDVFYQQDGSCRSVLNHFVGKITEKYGSKARIPDWERTVVVEPQSYDTIDSWNTLQLKIDLQPLSEEASCTVLSLPRYTTHIEDQIVGFCPQHKLSGMQCRELSFMAHNFVTALYFRPGGVSIQNVLQYTHLQLDLDMVYFPITLEHSGTGELSRYFFVSDTQYAVPSVCRFCTVHSLQRDKCKMFVDFADSLMKAYFGPVYTGQLWALQYVLYSLENIAQQRLSDRRTAGSQGSSNMAGVTADFVEIGTSNFDTVTQHVSDEDNFVGFAVEPSKHYLDSLPVRRGVRKVNAAIVTAQSVAEARRGSPANTVDLYYIPEQVIDRMGLFYYLKGCNSIGGYHPTHIEMGVTQHVVVDKVPAITITGFLSTERIHRIRLLKIDAEGYDLTIMEELYEHLARRALPVVHIDRIMFESNDEDQRSRISAIISKFEGLGYRIILTGENTIMENIKP